MGLSGQSVNSTFNTSTSTPLPSDLIDPRSTSVLSPPAVATTTSSMSTALAVVSQPTVSESTAAGTQALVSSPSANMSSTSLPLSPSSAAPSPSASTRADLPSLTNSASGSTPKTTGTSVQHTSGGPESTIVSVTVVHGTASGDQTNTITIHPASTLSNLVVSTTTDPNGSIFITTPPLVTIWSTSTDSNGSLITTTSVVANAQQEQQPGSESGILRNTGAVAGIFSVVGLCFATFVVGMVFCILRHRRTRRRENWVAEIRPQRPNSFSDDLFRDKNMPPVMRFVDTTTEEDIRWDQKGTLTPMTMEDPVHVHHNFDRANANMHPMFDSGTSNHPGNHQPQFVDITSSPEPRQVQFRHSLAPSTPSIYPASLTPEEDEHIVDYIVPDPNLRDEHISDYIVLDPSSSIATSSLPPRPPRSHLRDRAKSLDHRLPTPPDSESSNHQSRFYNIHNRKTVLAVQSRPTTS